MPRLARLGVPGVPHHVTQRGNGLAGDGLTETTPLLDRVGDWHALLDGGLEDAARDAIRGRERSGYALGSDAFVQVIGRAVGRDVRPKPRGGRRL
jgi:putative transposase